MSKQNDRSRTLIRELYQLSEAGAFDSVDPSTAETATDFLMTLMNPKLTYKQAEKFFGISEKNIMNHASRKIPEKHREKDHRTLIRYSELKKLFKKEEDQE